MYVISKKNCLIIQTVFFTHQTRVTRRKPLIGVYSIIIINNNNLCLIKKKLSTPYTGPLLRNIVYLPEEDVVTTNKRDDTIILLFQYEDTTIPSNLQEATTKVVCHTLCCLAYNKFLELDPFSSYVTKEMFCAGNFWLGGVSSCQVWYQRTILCLFPNFQNETLNYSVV